jgi:predicted dehydrogenase
MPQLKHEVVLEQVLRGAIMVKEGDLKLAMLGMVQGNGHPYSWCAIFNGYDPDEMAKQPFPRITEYLSREPMETIPIAGAKVTHVWTDDPADAELVSKASLVPNIVDRPEDVIGQVDAVLIPTDKGWEHVERCRPFVEAGLPVFVDKPLVDNAQDLKQFMEWVDDGKQLMSSSCMRYSKEYGPYRASTNNLGELRYASITTAQTWERYGIHALEGMYPILGPGFVSARNTGSIHRNVVHLKHERGIDINVIAIKDMRGSDALLQLCGTKDWAHLAWRDRFYSFKTQLLAFTEFVRTGVRPFPFEETVELMKLVIAGIRSREEGGREVFLSEVLMDFDNQDR